MLGAASVAFAVSALALAGAAVAVRSAGSTVDAKLTASQEVPKQVVSAPKAHGTFTSKLTGTAKTGSLRWRLTFAGLSSKAMAAHIHKGRPGQAGPIVVSLCGPCRSGANGIAKIDAKTMSAIKKGDAYVNVHTTKNPNGEIRGQLTESGT
jgi:hypothetical protein